MAWPPGVPVAGGLARHRYLILQLGKRSFAARHAENLLGWWWSLISTGVQLALFWFIFSRVFGIRIADPPDVGFGVYLMAGLVPFVAASDALSRAAAVFRRNAALVQRVRFPLEALVLGDLLGTVAYHLLPLGAVAAYCALTGHIDVGRLGWTALGGAILVLWIVGAGLLLSVVGAVLPDIDHVLTLGLQVLFYAAPIVYSLEMLPAGWLRRAVLANPLTPMIQLLRAGLIGATPPSPLAVGALVGVGCALLWVGAAALRRMRWRIPDLL